LVYAASGDRLLSFFTRRMRSGANGAPMLWAGDNAAEFRSHGHNGSVCRRGGSIRSDDALRA
jgi:hypothetical protein